MGVEQEPPFGSGIGGEPLFTPRIKNGGILSEKVTPDPNDVYADQDAHFEEVDKLVDQGVANYAEAREAKDYDPDEYEAAADRANHDPNPGVAVELGERAAAVTQLMDSISKQNKAAGALSALNNKESFSRQYVNPGRVVDKMSAKAGKYARAEQEAIETLAKTAALRAIGFDEQDADSSRASIERELNPLRTAGPQAARARKKQKEITENTAHIVNKNNTR